MKKLKILITGSCGFIGFNFINFILPNNYFDIYGIDNLNDYYDKGLKLDRLKLIKNKINFTKLDIREYKKLNSYLKKNQFDIIVHLAAQAGVRYSLENPDTYIDNNINGTFNILNIAKDLNLKHLLIASTSSVYGNNSSDKGFSEMDNTNNPLSLYSATKKSIEIISHSYSHNFKIPITIFRFFTVYGPWGRPDMALFKFINSISNNTPIEVYNNGELWRDFTYIDDLVKSVYLLLDVIPDNKTRLEYDSISPDAPFRILNIGNQQAVNLNDFVKILEKVMDKKAQIKFLPMQKGDVFFTLSNSKLLESLIGFVPSTSLEKGVSSFYKWYKDYYKIK